MTARKSEFATFNAVVVLAVVRRLLCGCIEKEHDSWLLEESNTRVSKREIIMIVVVDNADKNVVILIIVWLWKNGLIIITSLHYFDDAFVRYNGNTRNGGEIVLKMLLIHKS